MGQRNTPPGGGAVNVNVLFKQTPPAEETSLSMQYQNHSSGGAPIQGIARCRHFNEKH